MSVDHTQLGYDRSLAANYGDRATPMSTPSTSHTNASDRPFERLAVVGAGNMGSGIAQKMATEGFAVTLVDLDDEKVARGVGTIKKTLDEGIARGLFTGPEVTAILQRIDATSRFEDLTGVDLVVEAVFENLDVKKDVFSRLDHVCRRDAILATNTSSYAVTDLAAATKYPDRVIGLHYFYHPAKNRLVEVVAGKATDPAAIRRAWRLQEALGKTPIASSDSYGFIVNRFFLPWLTEAIRMLEEGVATTVTIDEAAKKAFGIGMGPFELMNVTGVPIALHAATTLGRAFGPMYEAPARLRSQTESGQMWDIRGTPDEGQFAAVAERLTAAACYVAAALVDEGVGTIEDTDIGARVGLRWRRGPFELMNHLGIDRARDLIGRFAAGWDLPLPTTLERQAASGRPFPFTLVRSETSAGIATLTINRPDALNAINESVISQLEDAFAAAAADPDVEAVVIAGSGKAFIAGADIRYFVRHIEAGTIAAIADFTKRAQALLRSIETCSKPVIARVHGLALGGGVELALACHAIVATPKASFAFPETGIGIYPGLGGTQRTPRRVGTGLAKWLILSGHTVGADEALAIGLIDRVVPYEELDRTMAAMISAAAVARTTPTTVPESHRPIAEFFDSNSVDTLLSADTPPTEARVAKAVKRIGSKAPIALRLAAELVDQSVNVPIEQGLELELSHLSEIFATRDAYEGLSSLGRKPPVFQGK
jgi:enoyl-CoA hydratase/3-hydroxyacyl-CoA dehydrogenase